MNKFDRLLNIGEYFLENNIRDVGIVKFYDRIVLILLECCKVEEVERFCFVESLVRDIDYELFIFWFLDLIDRSFLLKDLDEFEGLLYENMFLDVFFVEVEKLLDKLCLIEELIIIGMEDEDNVKDELVKYVVSIENLCGIS